jgi:hypothetical protein
LGLSICSTANERLSSIDRLSFSDSLDRTADQLFFQGPDERAK